MEDNEDLFDLDAGGQIETAVDNNDIEGIQFEETEFENQTEEQGSDYISLLLEARGIDRNKIQIYNDEGELVETSFDDLSDNEKFDLLNDTEEPVLPTDDELEVLNYLRKNNMTLKDFADWQRQQAIEEYTANQQTITDIDSYSDDEVIAYDFIQRFGEDMSDEEIDAEIERLKENPDAYLKRVNLLRTSYKNEELAQAKLYEEQEKNKLEADMLAFQNAYINSIQSIEDIQGITLDNNDKEELLQFVLTKDAANRTGFSKAMDDPATVLKMAWFVLHGEETFDATVDYFKKEIAKREKGAPRAVNRQTRQTSKDAFKF